MDETIKHVEQLYREIGPMLLAYFRQHRAVAGAAEDLLQDTFVRAVRNPGRLHAATSPRGYLFGIARHVCLDALRRRELPIEPMPAAMVDTRPAEDGRLEPMRAAIAELPTTHREPLLLKLQHDLTYEEIAEVLGVPVGTVRSRLHYAVARLKQTLNPNLAVPTRPSHPS